MVSTDTIQMLLRQRQELRESLLELRKEIETLDATSLNLVNKNFKNQSAGKTPAPASTPAPAQPAAASAPQAAPAATPAPTPTQAVDEAPAPSPEPTPAPIPEPKATVATPEPPSAPEADATPVAAEEASPPAPKSPVEAAPLRKEPVLAPPPEPKPAPEPAAPPAVAGHEDAAKDDAQQAKPKEVAVPAAPRIDAVAHHDAPPQEAAPTSNASSHPEAAHPGTAAHGAAADHHELEALIGKAEALSGYLLDHPSDVSPADLGAFNAAITVSAAATTRAEKTACYHTLQAAYRKVAGASFARSGVNGTTLEDSAAGSPLLWTIPFSLSLLIIVVFPLLLLARHLAGQMFTTDFAADLTFAVGLVAAFLWGTVGALTLLALHIAIEMRRRRFDGGIRLAPGLRGALGGLTGALCFLLLEPWLPMTGAMVDFALDAAAFAGGLLSALLFAAIQRVVSDAVGLIEPKSPRPAVSRPAKK